MARKICRLLRSEYLVYIFILLLGRIQLTLTQTDRVSVSPKVLAKLKEVLPRRECYFFMEFFIEIATEEKDREWAREGAKPFGEWPKPINCSKALDFWSEELFPPLLINEKDKKAAALTLLDDALKYAEISDIKDLEKHDPMVLAGLKEQNKLEKPAELTTNPSKIELEPMQDEFKAPKSNPVEWHNSDDEPQERRTPYHRPDPDSKTDNSRTHLKPEQTDLEYQSRDGFHNYDDETPYEEDENGEEDYDEIESTTEFKGESTSDEFFTTTNLIVIGSLVLIFVVIFIVVICCINRKSKIESNK